MIDAPWTTEARALVARLRGCAMTLREMRHGDLERRRDYPSPATGRFAERTWLLNANTAEQYDAFLEMLAALDSLLRDVGFEGPVPSLPRGQVWSLGGLDLLDEPRAIHGGFLQPIVRVLIAEPPSERVIAFLIAIKQDKDFLKREHHDHFGWHYHYLDHRKRRSNVMLCWDTRAARVQGAPHPLFWEKHAEGSRDFPARPDLWGFGKRASMHEACEPDLGQWPIGTFKTPGLTAAAVWPANAMLTPAPVSPPKPPGRRAGTRRAGRGR